MIETRELAYFRAVAGELHFGRAAQRLGIAQPPLSRAIRRLERRLGVTLLDRGGGRVALTPAGETLLAEGTAALDAVAAAVRRTRRAGTGAGLVLAMKPGGDAGLLPAILAAHAAVPGAVPVEVAFGFGTQAAMLRDGRADAALLYAPRADLTGLAAEELVTERQVAVLPRAHPLAGRDAVTLADVDAHGVPRWPRPSRPSGAGADGGPGDGPAVRDTGQLLQLVALGRVVAVLPESARGHLRADLAAVPVSDAEPTTLVLAWPETSRSRDLAAFVRAATTAAASAAANAATAAEADASARVGRDAAAVG